MLHQHQLPNSYPSNHQGKDCVVPFNKLYISATRPLKGLYVFDDQQNPLADKFKNASLHILSKCKDSKLEIAKEQTLDELIDYIRANRNIMNYAQGLRSVILKAIEEIRKQELDKKTAKSYLEVLQKATHTEDLALQKDIQTLLQPRY
ncbi:MAG UNVERIFIED_CONTAM: hypothetical protein LVQ98_06175 [Rickettsiaceae bacterium]|jgi:hypothetical protein